MGGGIRFCPPHQRHPRFPDGYSDIKHQPLKPGKRPAADAHLRGLNLLRGTLDMLVLQILSEAPCHGYAIGQQIQHLTDDRLRIEQGSLYPALYRLERHGWLKSKWQTNSASNRRAKFYQLTRKGRARLEADIVNWQRFVDSVSHVVPGS